ncbi:MAG TPA: DUF418 domain-containing protein [Allosphingosinicella sp.]|nr:DUF418 domain-containing protein [Allosphingosinicella sp.]
MPERGAARAERVDLLDGLRGFALFGILLANILYWSGWTFMQAEQRAALAGADGVAAQYLFHHAFVDGKFYTLFSLLFGIGFSLQLKRLEARELDAPRIFRRRLLILLGIGLIHMVLVWDGDILTFYALIGLLLPFFRNWSGRSLLIAAAILIFLVPWAGHALFEAMGWRPHQAVAAFGDRIFVSFGGNPADSVSWVRREEPSAFFAWVLSGWPFAISTRLESWRIPKLLGIMLLGLLLGRRLTDGSLLGNRRLLWWTFALGLAIGLPFSLAYGLTPNLGQVSLPSLLGTVPLALAYAAGFALAWPRWRGVLGIFVAPGRMALTNYLLQTILGIVIFYGIGFGLVGHVPPLGFYAIAAAIFTAQIAFSHWWLSRHAQGPMERLWRALTYAGAGSAR